MYLGIDIGGTKTLLAVLDDNGTILEQVKVPTPSEYTDFIQVLSENIPRFTHRDFRAAAAGVPGLLNRQSGIVHALGNLPWRDEPIRDDIARLAQCSVIIENDAKVAALAEAAQILHQYRRVLYLTISTGIGGGFVVGGLLEPNLQDCEVGHMVFPHEGSMMRWESFASGKAISEKYGKKASDIDDPSSWQSIANNLGLGIIACCAVTQVEAIIFGGGVGAYFEKFAQPLQTFIDQNLHNLIHKPVLLPSKHAELAVIYGCYELAKYAHGHINT